MDGRATPGSEYIPAFPSDLNLILNLWQVFRKLYTSEDMFIDIGPVSETFHFAICIACWMEKEAFCCDLEPIENFKGVVKGF